MWMGEVVEPEVDLRPGGPTRRHPLAASIWGLTWRGLAWGLGIGASAGSLAGTLIEPGEWTVPGALAGCYVAVFPTILGWSALLVVLGVGHRPLVRPWSAAWQVGVVLGLLLPLLLAIPVLWWTWSVAHAELTAATVGLHLWVGADIFLTAWFVVVLLRRAADSILIGWARPWGWQVARTPDRRTDEARAGSVATRDGRR